ncbi:MAG: hypothetical protein HZA54_16080 [Planctomycetes bacterium]|nr:hypothetical protein [Planctomycetota bacterium]
MPESIPARSRRARVLKSLAIGCGGLLLFVLFVVGVAFLFTGDQKKLLAAHLDALAAGDLDTAMKYVDASHIRKEELAAIVDQNPRVFKGTERAYPERKVSTEGSEIGVDITGTDGQAYRIRYFFSAGADGWKITGLASSALWIGPRVLTVSRIETSAERGEKAWQIRISFQVTGWTGEEKEGKLWPDVSVLAGLADPKGKVLTEVREVARFADGVAVRPQPLTGEARFRIPREEPWEEYRATVGARDNRTGKSALQTITLDRR